MSAPVVAIDATHDNAGHVPVGTPYVIGYVSGTPDIKWTQQDWSRLQSSHLIANYQGYGPAVTASDLNLFDEIDVESGAVTPEQAANIIAMRVGARYQWTTVYGTDSTLQAVAAATEALGTKVWVGHVLCRLADWNLDEQEAAAKIGTQIHGITCIGVQWASPTSNPHTVCPGTSGTLAQLQVDLSVVNPDWWDMARQLMPVPTPPPPAPRTGILVELPNGPALTLHSTDGKTWS